MDLLIPAGQLQALLATVVLFLAWAAVGLLFYGTLINGVLFEGRGRVQAGRLGRADILIVGAVTLWFLVNIYMNARTRGVAVPPEHAVSSSQMVAAIIANALFMFIVIGAILASLSLRGIPWPEVFGVGRLGPIAIVGRAMMLLTMAFPLIAGALVLCQLLLAALGYPDRSPQEIVEFLRQTESPAARWAVAISAVIIAPFQEEFVFRGYLYAVVRRHAGVPVGVLVNAAIFAAVHQNAPVFGGLFVLAVCLTIAYEWTGSIFVPMTMHALFNLLSIMNISHGG